MGIAHVAQLQMLRGRSAAQPAQIGRDPPAFSPHKAQWQGKRVVSICSAKLLTKAGLQS